MKHSSQQKRQYEEVAQVPLSGPFRYELVSGVRRPWGQDDILQFQSHLLHTTNSETNLSHNEGLRQTSREKLIGG